MPSTVEAYVYVPGATVKDVVADLAHTDGFEDELFVGEKVEDAVWILCCSIASWRVNPRAGRVILMILRL